MGPGRVRTGIAEPPKTQMLRPHDQEIAIGELGRLVDEEPASVPGAEVAHVEPSTAPFEACVHRRKVLIVGKADVDVATANQRLGVLERVGPLYLVDRK